MKQKRNRMLGASGVMLLCAPLPQVFANEAGNFISDGKAGLEFRYRYEAVEQDGRCGSVSCKDAEANTLRTRLNLQSGTVNGLSVFLEFDDLVIIGSDRFNSTRNNETAFPVVADPRGTEVNQLLVQYNGLHATVMRYGRQRINLDNQRFIGGVGHRQNEQTYDGFTVENKGIAGTTLFFGYIDNVNRVFGPDSGPVGQPAGDYESASFLLNGKYEGWKPAAVSIYHYALDFDSDDNPGTKTAARAASSQTTGFRLDGKHAFNKSNALLYTGEYARQSDYGDNPASYDADYWLLEAGFKFGDFSIHAGDEVLEGNANAAGTLNEAFQTPLATLHAFQGWADKFLVTPKDGLDDRYLKFKAKVAGLNIVATYDVYEAEDSSFDYGDEWGLLVAKKFGKTYELSLKYADYQAGDSKTGAPTDTTKWWFTGSAVF